MLLLSDSVIKIKGVGEQAQKKFNRLGIYTIEDLWYHVPRDYDQYQAIQPIRDLNIGEVVMIEGTLVSRLQVKTLKTLKIVTGTIQDASGKINVTWFQLAYLQKQLKVGIRYIFRGY